MNQEDKQLSLQLNTLFFKNEKAYPTVSVPRDALLTPPETGASTNFKFLPSSVLQIYYYDLITK